MHAELPEVQVIQQGKFKTIIEYKIDAKGQKVKSTRKIETKTIKTNKEIAARKVDFG